MRSRNLYLALGFVVVAGLGYFVASTAAPPRVPKVSAATEDSGTGRRRVGDDPAPRFRSGDRPATFTRDEDAAREGALPGQRSLVFSSRAALEDFLRRAGDKVRVMGRLDALNALRVGFLNYDDLAGLLDGTEQQALIYPVDVPAPGNASAQAGAVGLGPGLLDWLGISGDNSTWGSGVRIAVLDTGVAASQAFSSLINRINLVDLPSDLSGQNAHGTAVASMIIGNNSLTPGVAPGAEILSVRVANDLGQSDSYLLAQGIIAAADGGAQLINISLGSLGDSSLVRSAIEYARATGALIVAAAGNNGLDRVSYPAANDGVIAVGAVDALGNHLDFSNTGSEIAISAPGFEVNAAWTGDRAASVSGTSFSSPIVVGAIAALMSQSGQSLTAQQAANLLFSYLNDGGAEGADSEYGAGMPDIGRALNGTTRGIYDAAVASQRIVAGTSTYPAGIMEVMVQNRGTENLINTAVAVTTPYGVVSSNITSLAPGAVQTVRIPLPSQITSALNYRSQVTLSQSYTDIKPSNDRRSLSVPVPGTK